jgi:nitrite reductase/ring-hydroxylating ferredoxin subunit
MKRFRLFRYFILSLFFIVFSCGEEEELPDIPYVYVNFSINPNSTEYLELNQPGGWIYLTGGYRGILIYRLSMTDFMAFERACPYDPNVSGARIEVDTSGITTFCPVCHSKYILIDGSPFEGPSHYPLKAYRTTYDGNFLYVYN